MKCCLLLTYELKGMQRREALQLVFNALMYQRQPSLRVCRGDKNLYFEGFYSSSVGGKALQEMGFLL